MCNLVWRSSPSCNFHFWPISWAMFMRLGIPVWHFWPRAYVSQLFSLLRFGRVAIVKYQDHHTMNHRLVPFVRDHLSCLLSHQIRDWSAKFAISTLLLLGIVPSPESEGWLWIWLFRIVLSSTPFSFNPTLSTYLLHESPHLVFLYVSFLVLVHV